MVMEYVSGGELFDYICKHGRVRHFIIHSMLNLRFLIHRLEVHTDVLMVYLSELRSGNH